MAATTPIDPTELPDIITSYLEAHQARDLDTAMSSYAADASVTDEGQTYTGADEIRTWLGRSASEYTYTTEFTGATVLERQTSTTVDVGQHLEGDFPGGVADLHYRFTLDGALISRLVIEP